MVLVTSLKQVNIFPRRKKPLGIWIALGVTLLFLLRSLLLPIVIHTTSILGEPSPFTTIAFAVAILHLIVGGPVAAVALIGILKRRIWGCVAGLITCLLFFLFPLFLVIIVKLIATDAPWMIAPQELPWFVIVGTVMSGVIAIIGAISLISSRLWFDDYLR